MAEKVNNTGKAVKYIGFRTTDEIYDKFQELSEENQRSISFLVNEFLKEKDVLAWKGK